MSEQLTQMPGAVRAAQRIVTVTVARIEQTRLAQHQAPVNHSAVPGTIDCVAGIIAAETNVRELVEVARDAMAFAESVLLHHPEWLEHAEKLKNRASRAIATEEVGRI